MAAPVFTTVPLSEDVLGSHVRAVQIDVTGGSNTYLAGGIKLPLRGGAKTYTGGVVISSNAAAARLKADFNAATGKLIVSYPTGGATASPAALADPISTSGAATASAVDATTPNITPGRGKEVSNSTDLSSCTWRILLLGY